MNSLVFRIGLVVTGLMAVASALVAFLPTNPENYQCGIWLRPEWTEEESRELAEDYADLGDTYSGLSYFQEDAAESYGSAMYVASAYNACDDALDGRRLWTLILFGGAILVPIISLFLAQSGSRSNLQPVPVSAPPYTGPPPPPYTGPPPPPYTGPPPPPYTGPPPPPYTGSPPYTGPPPPPRPPS